MSTEEQASAYVNWSSRFGNNAFESKLADKEIEDGGSLFLERKLSSQVFA